MNRNDEFMSRARDTPIHWPGTIKRILDDEWPIAKKLREHIDWSGKSGEPQGND